jgi:NAD(P)-dependent dehydrogenase (short-subunit alcohol dehydrogenase family)
MARAFAAELGKHSIRVNSVHPGPVNTPMGSGAGAIRRRAVRAYAVALQRDAPAHAYEAGSWRSADVTVVYR